MPVLHLHVAASLAVDQYLVPMVVFAAGSAAEFGRLAGHGPFHWPQVVGRQLVRVRQPAPHEHVADGAHHHQQQRADRREADDAAQHDLAGPDRLGDHGVQRPVLDVRRQAEAS